MLSASDFKDLLDTLEVASDHQLEVLGQHIYEMRKDRQRRKGMILASTLKVNDQARIGYTVKPKYLQGQPVTILELQGTKALVLLDRGPQGKFATGRVLIPYSLLEPIE